MVCQNLFKADQKSFSSASPKSSCYFASATAESAFHLASLYLLPASEVPQQNMVHSLPAVPITPSLYI